MRWNLPVGWTRNACCTSDEVCCRDLFRVFLQAHRLQSASGDSFGSFLLNLVHERSEKEFQPDSGFATAQTAIWNCPVSTAFSFIRSDRPHRACEQYAQVRYEPAIALSLPNVSIASEADAYLGR